MHSSHKSSKRLLSGILSAAMLANFCTVMPITAFADDDTGGEVQVSDSNGHRYQLFDTSMSWTDAESYCESIGGHLVTITSVEEQQYIIENLLPTGTKKTYFIGLSRDTDTAEWNWVTSEAFDYANWDLGEPNSTVENYVHMYANMGNIGTWNNTYNFLEGDWAYATSNCGFICEWEETESPVVVENKMKHYALFSKSDTASFVYSGWKSNINGNIYTGSSFQYSGSELYVTGRVDAVGSINTSGWKMEIDERNENVDPVDTIDYDKVIHDNAQPYDYYEESPAYVQDLNVIDKSIKVAGDVVISGTTFEGDCYIIADGNITYNVNDFNTTGRVFLYSRNGNITINGTTINLSGGIYAPNGNVSFNTYETNLTGFVWADSITYSGSIFNVNADNFDMLEPRCVVKTYTIDEDFDDGQFNGLGLSVPDELTLNAASGEVSPSEESVYGDIENGKGVKVTCSSGKSAVAGNGDTVTIKYGLSGFGEADVAENAVDLIILVDESWSMEWSNRMTQAKAAAKEIVNQMKSTDRCAVMGFSWYIHDVQDFTSDKTLLNTAIDNIRFNDGTNISNGLTHAVDKFDDSERQKYIILLSDGDDNTNSVAVAKAAGDKGIRIFTLMIGNGTLQMQNIAINSNGIYKNAPSSEDIVKIMSYFASEVFNVAGRNTTFKTTIKDANAVDISAITPEPSKVTSNDDGSVTVEWNIDRITIDEKKEISIPVTITSEAEGFADILENTSCVYYDRNGKPNVVYTDDVSLPVSGYAESGNWTVVFDSERETLDWENIYWNGSRYGDGTISVYVSASDDGENFSEPVKVENHQSFAGVSGRYAKISVDMTASSDGRSPELYDITIVSKDAVLEQMENSEPVLSINAKDRTKVNVPLRMRVVLSDDCLKSDISITWNCEDENVKFTDASKLLTSVICTETGSYDITCTVSDGENTVQSVKTIVCEPADSYADIDPEHQGEAAAPKISVVLPQYADKNEKISAKIEKLNNTEISWYSVIFNEKTPVEVSDDGEFTLTMPNKDGTYQVIVRAFDWSGKSDVKEYTIIVDSTAASVSIIPSSDEALIDSEAYFKVSVAGEHKIKELTYTLNGKNVTIPDNGILTVDTSSEKEYILEAHGLTIKDTELTASAKITVIEADTEKPVVKISFDKTKYNENQNAVITVTATDNVGVTDLTVLLNGKEITLDSNGKYTISKLKYGEYTVTANATDAAGNVGTATEKIKANDVTKPELTLTVDKTEVKVGENVNITVNASDNNGEVSTDLTVGTDKLTISDDNTAVFTPDAAGSYVIKATAVDPSGNKTEKKITIKAVEPDTIAPVVNITFDKDTYFEKDDVIITVEASDNVGVVNTILLVDGKEVVLSENGTYTISKAALKTYEIVAKAYDAENNEGITSATVVINEAKAPEISVTFDKDVYNEGDSLTGLVTVQGQSEIITLTATVNGKPLSIEDGMFSLTDLKAGEYRFSFTAEDSREKTSSIQKTITVLDEEHHTDERLYALVDGLVKYGDTAIYKVIASDDINRASVSVTLNGKKIELTDDLTYEFKGEKLFDNEFVLTAKTTDDEEITAANTVLVYETDKPILNVTLSKESNIQEHDDVLITVSAEDVSGIKKIMCLYDGVEIQLDENGQILLNDFDMKPHTMIFRAWDNFGNLSAKLLTFYVVETEVSGGSSISISGSEDIDTKALTAKIIMPTNEAVISSPTFVVGNAGGTEFKKYELTYQSASGGDYILIKEGSTSVNGQSLGEFDPTMLRNGLYNLHLTVWGKNGEVISDEVLVSVEGQMKIGNFSLDFEDIDVHTAGIPLSLIRSYDSRDRNVSGDFGYGWNQSAKNIRISTNGPLYTDWNMVISYNKVGVDALRNHIITVTWDNGKVEKFRMNAKIRNDGFGYNVTPYFEAIDGATSTLTTPEADGFWGIQGNILFDMDEGVTFNPSNWVLTTSDGTRYAFNTSSGLRSITDTNGNSITFNGNSITGSNTSLSISRDSQNRITSITSPTGKTVSYEYDENGDLAKVTDISGYETTFEYDNHYLTAIIDPRGVTVSRNVYDDNGRLIKTIDADGNEITYDHDIDGREETITDRNGGVTRYIYDHNGNVLSQTDPNGNTITNTYDSNGYLASKTNAMGNVTHYTYGDNGNMQELTDAEGNTVTNDYNAKGLITSINAMGIDIMKVSYDDKGNTTSTEDALGNVISYAYDNKGNLTSVTDEIGTYMNVTYDSHGNVKTSTNGVNTKAEFTYDENNNCTSKTLTYTSEGVSKTVTKYYSYDDAGNLVQIIDSDGNITTTEYNSIGKVAVATDEKGRQTSYEYDDLGNLSKITYADGTSEKFTYDNEGNNLTATDRLGRTVTMKYDKVGNLLSKTYPNGAVVKYSYDKNYNLISTINASGNETKYEYDKVGRNTAIIDALGNRTEFSYNSHSQLGSMTDAKGNTYTYSYDDNGNRISTIYPDGSSVSSTYDARGRVTSQTDQHGYTTSYTYDGADRLTSVTDELGNTTSYTYDEVGNLIKVTDANNHSTTYTYDDFGRVIKTTNALGKTAEATYDVCGNILTSKDFGGKLTSYTYDTYDRLISKETADGTTTFAYTTDGKLSSVTDASGTIKYTYNSMDGLSKVEYPNSSYVSYSYDDASRLTSVKTSFGTTSYEYDKLDRLVRVVDRNGYATLYEYDANGNRSAVRYANGIIVTYEYDEVNRLIKEKALDKNGGLVAQYEYTLGAAGERTKVKELDRTVDYTYDELYRLKSEKIAADGETTEYTYAYDNVSNRILKTENGAKTSYTYNALNQLVSENGIAYAYDNAGNLTSVTSDTKSALYAYNAENKMIRATVQEGNAVSVEEYEYDYAGNRTVKKSENDYTYYLNDVSSGLMQVLAELDVDGNEKCYYTRGTEIISQERNRAISYYLTDGHGSVRQLANSTGVVTDTYVYDAWGNLISSTGNTENSYLYCGEQLDSTTGLYYLRARYMNPTTGTFTTMDTYQGSLFDPTSLHKYLYANANPVMNVDPSGYMGLLDHETAMAGGAEIDKAEAAHSQFALKFWKNFLKKMGAGTIGGLIAVGDQWSAGVTDPDELAAAFRKGFFAGFAFSFASGKVAMALGSLGVVGGFAGAVKSFKNGDFWQGIYRLSLSILGGAGLYKSISGTPNSTPDVRYKVGEPAKPVEKTLDMMLDRETYANEVAKHYGINLKGSGQIITIKYDPDLAAGQYGRTFKSDPTVIRVGEYAFSSEEELAATIAHELNHARSFLKGGDAPESTAYAVEALLRAFIRGEL